MLPADLVVMDLETRSLCDLKKEGGRRYARHASTEIMAGGFWDGEKVLVWSPLVDLASIPDNLLRPFEAGEVPIEYYSGKDCPDAIQALSQRPWAAHNAWNFDRAVWNHCGLDARPTEWWDTLPLSCALGLPRGLDAQGKHLLGKGKHSGSALTLRLAQPMTRGKHKGRFLPLGRGNIPAVIQYLVMDVLLLRDIVEKFLRPAFADYPLDLPVYLADSLINDRGVAFDADMATAIVQTELALRDTVATDLVTTASGMLGQTGDEVRALLRSQPKFLGLLREEFGVNLPDLQRQTLRAFLDSEQPQEPLRTLLLARIGESAITSAKLSRGLQVREPDDTLRSILLFHGARTGRWTGRLVQLHNLPGTREGVDLDAALRAFTDDTPTASLVRAVKSLAVDGGVTTADILSALIRAVLRARQGYTLGIADYSGIEARVLMWLAGDADGLAVFKRGGDPYVRTAAAVYGVSEKDIDKPRRQAGKVAVLLAGYGGGAKRLGEAARAWGIDLEEVGTTPTAVVEGWRDLHSKIAGRRTGREYNGVQCREGGMWKDMEKAFIGAIRGQRTDAYKCSVKKWRKHVVIELPSGKPLIYRDARMEPRDCFGAVKDRPVFTEYRGNTALTVDTYGGKLTENVCQAVATGSGGFLGDAIVRMELRGFRPVLHVHDEVVAEVRGEDDFRDLLRLLSTPPKWARGFPLAVAGFMSDRYRKAPPRGVSETVAQGGKIREAHG